LIPVSRLRPAILSPRKRRDGMMHYAVREPRLPEIDRG
jgi:hypothetical protein